jgi:hypothetical protein
LRRGLGSIDAQQRYLAAFLLACAGTTHDVGVVVRELVPHLNDNHTLGDALMAAHALYRLGRQVVPMLHYWRTGADEQGRRLIDLILLDLDQPPRTRDEFVARSWRHGVTCVYHDPVIEFDIDRSTIATR